MYRVRGPDGLWVKKGANVTKIYWVKNEEMATFWRKLSHLKCSLKDGIFSEKDNLEGLPLAALEVVEYVATIKRTGQKNRITELGKFYIEENDKCRKCGSVRPQEHTGDCARLWPGETD